MVPAKAALRPYREDGDPWCPESVDGDRCLRARGHGGMHETREGVLWLRGGDGGSLPGGIVHLRGGSSDGRGSS